MDLKLEVYSPELDLMGMAQNFSSILWEEEAFSAGSFSLQCPLTPEARELLTEDCIVWIEGETAGIIEYINPTDEESGQYITVKGRLLSGILSRRILWGRYDLSGAPAALMYRLVRDCAITPSRGTIAARVIPGLVTRGESSATGTSIRKQKTGGELLEALEELGEAHNVAFGVAFNPELVRMEFWARAGIDRSVNQAANDPVLYSTELDDVLESEYMFNSGDFKNVALVAGEGEGAERTYITVNDVPEGMQRREMFVDARDLQSEEGTTQQEYEESLATRGGEKLAEMALVQEFSATVRTRNTTYEYGRDFFLGDTITVADERLGVTVDAVVRSVSRSATQSGETVSFTFGYGQPTVHKILKRKADK